MKRCIFVFALILTFLIPFSAYGQVSLWAKKDVEYAESIDILPESFCKGSYRDNITRAEFSEIVLKSYLLMSGEEVTYTDESVFKDTDNKYVTMAAKLKLVSGMGDGLFMPENDITREQAAVMFKNVYDKLNIKLSFDLSKANAKLKLFSDSNKISSYAEDAVLMFSYYEVLKGNDLGEIIPKNMITREQAVALSLRLIKLSEKVPVNNVYPVKKSWLLDNEEYPLSAIEKYNKIFEGSEIFTKEDADKVVVSIPVRVWLLNEDGTKREGKLYLTVHKNIADEVTAVFDEIFNGEERFPIYEVGGYSWRAPMSSERLSHHNFGTAIDINSNENYCIYNSGATIGSYYKPGEDPYSILPDGEVVKAFAKHGFIWGGTAWSNPKDYMHFSYLGL